MTPGVHYCVICSSSEAYLTHSTHSSVIVMFIFLLSPYLTPYFYLGIIHLLLAKSLVASDLVIERLFTN